MQSVVKSEKSFSSAQSELGCAAEEEEPGAHLLNSEVLKA